MSENRFGLLLFFLFLLSVAIFLNWQYYRERIVAAPVSDDILMRQIVADLSNLPTHIGAPKAPIVFRVKIDPEHSGPCIKGTVEFLKQLVRDYPGKVQIYFHKVKHGEKLGCSTDLTINGKKTFVINLGDRPQTITLHGVARPGDPMSFYIRQIVEQEIEKKTERKEVRKAENKRPN